MGYYSALNLIREPFSNSPDPGLFYHTAQHQESLQQLEISIRLKRGLNVVIGDVGTGKTTLSRQLIQMFARDTSISTAVLLDPGYDHVTDFLAYILQLLTGRENTASQDENQLKEAIKNHLFTQGADQNRLTVLIVDEGQKLTVPCLEALRELLNYETNDYKLLQIVIFAQNEFKTLISSLSNFRDRINFSYELKALDFKDTRGLIAYRLKESAVEGKAPPVFTLAASWELYRATGGYPRKIVKLCHYIILALIVQQKNRADYFTVRASKKKAFPYFRPKRAMAPALFMGMFVVVLSAGGGYYLRSYEQSKEMGSSQLNETVSVREAQASIDAPNRPAATPEPAATTPAVLGRLTIQKNESFCAMLSAVYGACTHSVIDELLKVNPAIKDPALILSGSDILFPALPYEGKPEQSGYLVHIRTLSTLDEAWTILKKLSACDGTIKPETSQLGNYAPIPRYSASGELSLRIIPQWKHAGGLVFHLVIDRLFLEQNDALSYLSKLPETMTGRLDSLATLKDGAILYSKRI